MSKTDIRENEMAKLQNIVRAIDERRTIACGPREIEAEFLSWNPLELSEKYSASGLGFNIEKYRE